MMLFNEHHVSLILNGIKTQSRRMCLVRRWNVGAVHLAKTKMISKEYFARLKILDVYQESLVLISEDDARAEGYDSKEAYLKAFREIYKINDDAEWSATLLSKVWVIKFQVVE
jgi:hypothetical protein